MFTALWWCSKRRRLPEEDIASVALRPILFAWGKPSQADFKSLRMA
jgi:hypothetical protein